MLAVRTKERISLAISIGLALFLLTGMLDRPPPLQPRTAASPAPERPEQAPTPAPPAMPALTHLQLPPPPPEPTKSPSPSKPRPEPVQPDAAAPPAQARAPVNLDPTPKSQPLPKRADPKIEDLVRRAPAPTPDANTPVTSQETPAAQASFPSTEKPADESTAPAILRSPAVSIETTEAADLADGRALLRMLEAGKGPRIEIAWPDSRNAREELFAAFHRCLGMQVALLSSDNRLFFANAAPGHASPLQRDRMSLFLRSPTGAIPSGERRLQSQIRARHNVPYATPVRLVPRVVDAALIGGLFRLLGPAYQPGSSIRARYRLHQESLHVEDINIDGRDREGRVVLSLSLLQACRSSDF